MDHQNHDQKFFATFGIVMGALFGIFFICVFVARLLVSHDGKPDEEALVRIEERIKSPSQAVTDPSMLLKASASKPAREPYSGEQVMAKVCSACHATGLLDAPKTGDHAAWNKRKAANGGLEGLVASAIKGKNAMPPRGGDADLSEAEIKQAVEQLMK